MVKQESGDQNKDSEKLKEKVDEDGTGTFYSILLAAGYYTGSKQAKMLPMVIISVLLVAFKMIGLFLMVVASILPHAKIGAKWISGWRNTLYPVDHYKYSVTSYHFIIFTK